jgi:hypothetical protein
MTIQVIDRHHNFPRRRSAMSLPVRTKSSRPTTQVNPRLDKSLAAYMAAAGAAGVALLAAQSAEAKIVYTPAHTTIAPRSSVPIDLNHDGVNDFLLSNWQYGQVSHLSVIHQAASNGVISKNQALGAAADLPLGVQIGPARFFEEVGSMATQGFVSGVSFAHGPWEDAHNRYLGLKFSINGETHYGWARLTVTTKGSISATLSGYAYETVPNRPIIMGQMSGTDTASAAKPEEMLAPSDRSATLGMLARGANSLTIWRRDEEVISPAV